MPRLVPNAPPPRPPDNPDAVVAYNKQLIVWLTSQLDAIREDCNWLIQQQNIRNLVPDSDIKEGATFWTVDAGWAITEAVGIGGGRAFTAVGPLTADATSDTIAVRAGGDFYVLSGWIDARDMTGGTLSWLVKDAFGPTVFGEATQVIGQTGRVQVPFTVPTGFSVKVVLRAIGMTTGATGVICSEPQLELPDAPHLGVNTPSATLYRTNIGVH